MSFKKMIWPNAGDVQNGAASRPQLRSARDAASDEANAQLEEMVAAMENFFSLAAGRPVKRAKPRKAAQAVVPQKETGSALYDLSFVNSSLDWPALLPKMRRDAQGCFCFYGLPGTGKTALAHEIARHLARPLMAVRGSDLLSSAIGETEARVAKLFRDAARRKAVLLIDEVEGLLFDRREASRSWELTQTNEFLCQMEDFQGLFICTTNCFDRLDPATLRRFALKCEFKPLRPEQSRILFDRHLDLHDIKGDRTGAYARVEAMSQLAPGDFKAALRRLQIFSTDWTPDDLARQLQEECDAKGVGAAPIGFV